MQTVTSPGQIGISDPSLFDWMARSPAPVYPNVPGSKREGTSTEAKPANAEAATLRDQVLALLRQRELTADECALSLNISILSCRPRLSELVALGKIEETDQRRLNSSGKSASVWKAKA